ncbi:MAG: hypothetical protein ABIS20_06230 [Thermoanaerobaculia bacterium]
MEELSKEQLEAIARAGQQVAGEVQDHKDEDKELEDVVGGTGITQETLWEISVSYKT